MQVVARLLEGLPQVLGRHPFLLQRLLDVAQGLRQGPSDRLGQRVQVVAELLLEVVEILLGLLPRLAAAGFLPGRGPVVIVVGVLGHARADPGDSRGQGPEAHSVRGEVPARFCGVGGRIIRSFVRRRRGIPRHPGRRQREQQGGEARDGEPAGPGESPGSPGLDDHVQPPFQAGDMPVADRGRGGRGRSVPGIGDEFQGRHEGGRVRLGPCLGHRPDDPGVAALLLRLAQGAAEPPDCRVPPVEPGDRQLEPAHPVIAALQVRQLVQQQRGPFLVAERRPQSRRHQQPRPAARTPRALAARPRAPGTARRPTQAEPRGQRGGLGLPFRRHRLDVAQQPMEPHDPDRRERPPRQGAGEHQGQRDGRPSPLARGWRRAGTSRGPSPPIGQA